MRNSVIEKQEKKDKGTGLAYFEKKANEECSRCNRINKECICDLTYERSIDPTISGR